MNVNNKKFNEIFFTIIIFQTLILFNYGSWFLNYTLNLKWLRVFLVIFMLIIIAYLIVKNFSQNKLLYGMLVFFIFLSLGSPSFYWDARSVWLFTSKQIFFDQGFLYIIQNYSPIHGANAYPVLGPTLSSSIAELFGYWNEVFPKFFSLILSIPPLIYLGSLLRGYLTNILFIFLVFFILDRYLIIGEMDGIVALYFTVSAVLSYQLFQNTKINNIKQKSAIFYLFCFLNFSILSILKKEAFFYLLIIFISSYLANLIINKKKIINIRLCILCLSSLIIFILWELFTAKHNIDLKNYPGVSIIFEANFINLFLERLIEVKNILIISKGIFFTKPFIISILISTFFITFVLSGTKKLKNSEKTFLLYGSLIVIFYLLFIFFIYTVTSYDLEWHLRTSATRVMLPISFLLAYLCLIFKQEKYNLIK